MMKTRTWDALDMVTRQSKPSFSCSSSRVLATCDPFPALPFRLRIDRRPMFAPLCGTYEAVHSSKPWLMALHTRRTMQSGTTREVTGGCRCSPRSPWPPCAICRVCPSCCVFYIPDTPSSQVTITWSLLFFPSVLFLFSIAVKKAKKQ
jgi:hypothetical protein